MYNYVFVHVYVYIYIYTYIYIYVYACVCWAPSRCCPTQIDALSSTITTTTTTHHECQHKSQTAIVHMVPCHMQDVFVAPLRDLATVQISIVTTMLEH